MEQSSHPSLLAFCICNLIIALLLLASAGGIPTLTIKKPVLIGDAVSETKLTGSFADEQVEEDVICAEEEAQEEEEEEEEALEGDEDDELEKRAEEFIERMNRILKAERDVDVRMN